MRATRSCFLGESERRLAVHQADHLIPRRRHSATAVCQARGRLRSSAHVHADVRRGSRVETPSADHANCVENRRQRTHRRERRSALFHRSARAVVRV